MLCVVIDTWLMALPHLPRKGKELIFVELGKCIPPEKWEVHERN